MYWFFYFPQILDDMMSKIILDILWITEILRHTGESNANLQLGNIPVGPGRTGVVGLSKCEMFRTSNGGEKIRNGYWERKAAVIDVIN